MKLVLKAKNASSFDRQVTALRATLFLKKNETGFVYETNGGSYTAVSGGLLIFSGKRQSFGKSKFMRIKRISRTLRKDKLVIELGDKQFDLEVEQEETSAPNKPFWATCSDKNYAALTKLLAR